MVLVVVETFDHYSIFVHFLILLLHLLFFLNNRRRLMQCSCCSFPDYEGSGGLDETDRSRLLVYSSVQEDLLPS